MLQLLLLGNKAEWIAEKLHVSKWSVDELRRNLLRYGSVKKPSLQKLGRPPILTQADKDAIFEQLLQESWMYHDEIAWWVWEEREKKVSAASICRLLKNEGWTRKKLRRIARNRSEELRQSYREEMLRFEAEDLVFLDESIFNEQTGWRSKAYAPIGHEARYIGSASRGRTCSILGAVTTDGFLPCIGYRDGYFNTQEFLEWIVDYLLPALTEKDPGKSFVIVLDNLGIHTQQEVIEAIERAGHVVRFLPPYSPDFNPIELFWGVLKAWIRRNYHYKRQQFGTYAEFLQSSIITSKCDYYARRQFRHAAGGVCIEREELERLRRELADFEAGNIELPELLEVEVVQEEVGQENRIQHGIR
jgi:transposase